VMGASTAIGMAADVGYSLRNAVARISFKMELPRLDLGLGDPELDEGKL